MTPRPVKVRLAIFLVGLQGIGFGAYLLFGIVEIIRGNFAVLAVALPVLLSAALMAAVLFAATRGLGNGRPWVRGIIITSQIIWVLVGVSLIQGGFYVMAAPLVVWAVAVLALMFSKEVNAFIGPRNMPFADQD